MTKLTWRTLGCALAITALLGAPAVADDKDDKKGDDRRDAKEQQKDWKFKAFELKHRNPLEVARIVSLRWQMQEGSTGSRAAIFTGGPGQAGQPTRGQPGAGRPGAGQPDGTGAQGRPDSPGGVQPAGRGGPPQPAAVAFGSPERDLVLVAVPDEKFLMVRGKEDKINKIEELVKALDVPKDELEKKSFGDMTLIPVRHGKAARTSMYLSLLQIENRPISLGDRATLLVVRANGDEEVVKQAREVIKKLDADGTND